MYEDDDVDNTPRPHRWAVKSDGFNMWLQGEHVHAKNMVIDLTEAQNKELVKLIKTGKRNDLTTELTYVDFAAAEAIAREHMASQRGAAHSGSVHSGASAERQEVQNNSSAQEIKNPSEPKGMTLLQKAAASRAAALHQAEIERLVAEGTPKTPIEGEAIHAGDSSLDPSKSAK